MHFDRSRNTTSPCPATRFAVTPLTEDCGILEWVPKTGTLRIAVQGIYEQEGHFDRKTNGVIDSMYKHHEHKYQVCAAAGQALCAPSI